MKKVETRPSGDGGRESSFKSQVESPSAEAHVALPSGSWSIPDTAIELFHPAQFLMATRDSGYRSTAFSLAEFVDNSIQAGASTVLIELRPNPDPSHPIEILVSDDGHGMDGPTLTTALAFGGSSRFGNRESLGRYGMGLPNGGLSRARRVEVYTWRDANTLHSVLDLDDQIAKNSRCLPAVAEIGRPDFLPPYRQGTTIRLTKCDRLEHKRMSTMALKLRRELGQIYRSYIAAGLAIHLNGEPVDPIDPLFLDPPASSAVSAVLFGDVLTYRMSGPSGDGTVRVKFSELPVGQLNLLPTKLKRDFGITGTPNVSILRADREIDRGWFFMGGKRRENYDDWWRCEISFDPSLDEMFGITNAKQEIRPTQDLCQALERDLEPIARALNARVRRRFEIAKATTPLAQAEAQAARANLPPVPRPHCSLLSIPKGIRPLDGLDAVCGEEEAIRPYVIRVAEFSTTGAYHVVVRGSQTQLYLNVRHPLYRHLYEPLANSDDPSNQRAASNLALVILAAARAEVGMSSGAKRDPLGAFRALWADVLATFINA